MDFELSVWVVLPAVVEEMSVCFQAAHWRTMQAHPALPAVAAGRGHATRPHRYRCPDLTGTQHSAPGDACARTP